MKCGVVTPEEYSVVDLIHVDDGCVKGYCSEFGGVSESDIGCYFKRREKKFFRRRMTQNQVSYREHDPICDGVEGRGQWFHRIL